jgi:hypothetical protein
MEVLKHKVRCLEEAGAFPLSERAHLPMRGGALCDDANTATLQKVTKLVPNLVTDSTMESEPSTTLNKVTTVGSKRYTV